jgi:polysaccharide export outer membrane protein
MWAAVASQGTYEARDERKAFTSFVHHVRLELSQKLPGVYAMWSAKSGLLRRCWLLFFVLAFIVFTANAIAQQNPAEPGADSTKSASDSWSLRLGAGDLVEFNVYGVPELSTKARVANTGDLYLPLIGYVHVADLTLEEAQALLEKRLSDGGFVKNPHVTMFIDEYASQGITIIGEVARPGIYPVLGDRRLFDVLSAAGGLTDKAGRNITITHRNSPDHPKMVHLSQHIERGTGENVEVAPGDTILVARAGVVYVVGDVGRPSGFLMDSDSITVLQAIAMAGGTTKTAKLNGSRIIRKTAQGAQETPIQLKKIMQAKAPDLTMQADDILFVPSSAGKTAMYRGAESVLQAVTALSIVAAYP